MTTPVERPRPVILHLGGDPARIDTTIAYAIAYPTARIIISSEQEPRRICAVLEAMAVPRRRVTFDFAAWDTVTNFTHTRGLVGDATDLFVVTGQRHMPRAMAIAAAVYAGRGVRLVEATFRRETMAYPEPWLRHRWDVLRAHIWRWTGVLLYNPWIRARRIARSIRPAASEVPAP